MFGQYPGTERSVKRSVIPTALLVLAVATLLLAVTLFPPVGATDERYTVHLDANGGSLSGMEDAFLMEAGSSRTLPVFCGTVREGMYFAGWSFTDGMSDGTFRTYTQNIDFKDGSVFVMDGAAAERAEGHALTLYAVWHPRLTAFGQVEIPVCLTGTQEGPCALDLTLSAGSIADGVTVPSGSIPLYVPPFVGGFSLTMEGGICFVTSDTMFPGNGCLELSIPAVYATDPHSTTDHILVIWVLELTIVGGITAFQVN